MPFIRIIPKSHILLSLEAALVFLNTSMYCSNGPQSLPVWPIQSLETQALIALHPWTVSLDYWTVWLKYHQEKFLGLLSTAGRHTYTHKQCNTQTYINLARGTPICCKLFVNIERAVYVCVSHCLCVYVYVQNYQQGLE